MIPQKLLSLPDFAVSSPSSASSNNSSAMQGGTTQGDEFARMLDTASRGVESSPTPINEPVRQDVVDRHVEDRGDSSQQEERVADDQLVDNTPPTNEAPQQTNTDDKKSSKDAPSNGYEKDASTAKDAGKRAANPSAVAQAQAAVATPVTEKKSDVKAVENPAAKTDAPIAGAKRDAEPSGATKTASSTSTTALPSTTASDSAKKAESDAPADSKSPAKSAPTATTATQTPAAESPKSGANGQGLTGTQASPNAAANAAQPKETQGSQGKQSAPKNPTAGNESNVAGVVNQAKTESAAPASSVKTQNPLTAPEPYKQVVQVVHPLRGRDGEYNLTISLAPEQLGRVDVSLNIAGNNVNMQMNADNQQARQLLRDSMNELRNELNDSGFNAGSLDVDSQDPGQQSRESASSRGHVTDGDDIELTDEEFFARLAATPAASTKSEDGSLNVLA